MLWRHHPGQESGVVSKRSEIDAHPAGQPQTAEDNQRDKRDRIIERAIIMFNQLGYDRVRIADISDSLGMGKGTFYLYFRNKKDLLLRCFDHVGELILELESLPAIRQGDFFEKVGPRVESIGRRDWFPGLVNLLRAAELSPDAEIKTKAREAYDCIALHLRRDLEATIKAGRAREVDPDLVAYAFVGMAENLWFRARLDHRYSAAEIVDFMVEETKHWLSVRPAARNTQGADISRAASVVCRDGTRFQLTDARFDGSPTIPVTLGQAQIDLQPERLTSFVLGAAAVSDNHWPAHVRAGDGSEYDVLVDGSVCLSGDTAVGTVRIAARHLAGITWGE
jgi:AcrR family transcriptional regulator